MTHPYQSTVDDLLKSRYAGKLDSPLILPPVDFDANKTSLGNPLTVIGFDDLDRVVIHKRK